MKAVDTDILCRHHSVARRAFRDAERRRDELRRAYANLATIGRAGEVADRLADAESACERARADLEWLGDALMVGPFPPRPKRPKHPVAEERASLLAAIDGWLAATATP